MLRRIVATHLMAVQLASCTSMQMQGLAPDQPVQPASRLVLRLTNGQELELSDAWVRGDTIVGGTRVWEQTEGTGLFAWTEGGRRIPRDSVAAIGVRRADAVLTTAAIVLGLGAAAGAALLIGLSTCDCGIHWGGDYAPFR